MKKMTYIPILIVLAVALPVVGVIQILNKSTNNTTASSSSPNSNIGTVVDLHGKAITQVSSTIYDKTDTTTLILSNNSIQTLPSQMGRLTNLTAFKLDHNQLKGSLIAEIHDMSKLQTLDVSYNDMTGMPAEIGQLHNLQTLNYSHNQITGLPTELANLKNNLKTFNLIGNPLNANQIAKLKTELPNTKVLF